MTCSIVDVINPQSEDVHHFLGFCQQGSVNGDGRHLFYTQQYHPAHYDESFFNLLSVEHPPFNGALATRKAEFLVGRYCASKLLAKFGVAGFPLRVGENREPLWPHGFVGSISHCQNWVHCEVASAPNYAGIGVDLEQPICEASFDSVRKIVITQKEQELFWETAKLFDDSLLVATLYFSAKESFFKASFGQVGHYFDFDVVHLVALDETNRQCELELQTSLSGSLPASKRVTTSFNLDYQGNVLTRLILPRDDG